MLAEILLENVAMRAWWVDRYFLITAIERVRANKPTPPMPPEILQAFNESLEGYQPPRGFMHSGIDALSDEGFRDYINEKSAGAGAGGRGRGGRG